ncbi:DUF421 domain-containing protein [Bacillus sp. MRMR6]|uniref:DUF421 domain-containing protein n=1 Tax=Bacillus sp. MRMR6 TaxID=1928617 RepID=UPI000AAA1549|nr:DUF421 domain-containing protein [Bacillus sp. MRMR6]
MNQYLSIGVELLSGLLLLFLMTKFLGKTHFSQLTPFDFISALILGELVGNAVYDDNISIKQIAFAILIWGLLISFLETITQKFGKTRKILEGEPNILIHKGVIKYEILKKIKLDINQLQSLIRQQGYFSIQEVEFAIMETNGTISVLPKFDYDNPKNSELKLPSKSVDLPVSIIIDGAVINKNLAEAGIDEKWLKNQLELQNISDYKDVLYAEWTKNQPLFIHTYKKNSG